MMLSCLKGVGAHSANEQVQNRLFSQVVECVL